MMDLLICWSFSSPMFRYLWSTTPCQRCGAAWPRRGSRPMVVSTNFYWDIRYWSVFGGQSEPQSTIVEQLLDGAENFLQTSRYRAADRRLAGQEVRNPTLEPLDRTEGMRPHRIQIEQAAELVFPE